MALNTHFTLDSVCSPSENIVARVIEGELLIVPLVADLGDAEDALYTLNQTGQAIWHKLDGLHSLGEIINELTDEFDASRERIQEDLFGLVTELVNRGMVRIH